MPGPEPMMPPPDVAMPPQPMTPPPPPLPAPASGAGAPGDLMTRFIARLIDGILVGVANGIISIFIFGGFVNPMAMGIVGFTGRFLLYSVIAAAITIAYFALMESNSGQTLGKMLMSLRTERAGGGKPTMEQALKRNAFYALNIIPFLGWLALLAVYIYIAVTINNSPTRQGWHDKFAGGTQVVKTK